MQKTRVLKLISLNKEECPDIYVDCLIVDDLPLSVARYMDKLDSQGEGLNIAQ